MISTLEKKKPMLSFSEEKMFQDAWLDDQASWIAKYGASRIEIFHDVQEEKRKAEDEMALINITHDLFRLLEGRK